MSYNILATTYRQRENEAASELFSLLSESGDYKPKIERTGVSGLIAAATKLPYETVREAVKKLASEEPWRIRFLLRLLPIERVVQSSVESIVGAVAELTSKISQNESFRITVEKRHTSIVASDLVIRSAERVNRRVDLDNPDWVVLIEVVGKWTGVSVARPNDIVSITKLKKGL